MHDSDDALAVRERSDEATLRQLVLDLARPISFPKPTVMRVLLESSAPFERFRMQYVICELWVDRNIALREMGVNLSRDRYASAYRDKNTYEFVVSGNDRTLVEELRRRLPR